MPIQYVVSFVVSAYANISTKGTTETQLGLELASVSFEILHKEGKDEQDSIAAFKINRIKLELQISSENCMKLDVQLQSIYLLDTRKNTDSKFPVSSFPFLAKYHLPFI